jgi:hypothetical protein
MMRTVAAGWFPDPGGGHTWRYWDGTQWTDAVADQGVTTVESVARPGVPHATGSPPRSTRPSPPPPGRTSPGTSPVSETVTVGRVAVVVCLTLVWPVAQLAVFWLRFGHLPPGGPGEGLVFLPMALVAAVVTVWLWSRSVGRRQQHCVAAGYLLAIPVALYGALLGGLALPWFLGPLVFGGVPLVCGAYAGFVMGRTREGLLGVALLTGGSFVVGGLSRLPFLESGRDSWPWVFVALMTPVVVQAVLGCGVLARRLQGAYPARRMWRTGVAALTVGSAVPVALAGGFYYLLYPVVGAFVGLIFGLLLGREHAPRRMLVVCGAGYLVALLVMGWVASAASFIGDGGWDAVSSSAPGLLTGALPLAAGDFVVGLSIALGVHWALLPAQAARGG